MPNGNWLGLGPDPRLIKSTPETREQTGGDLREDFYARAAAQGYQARYNKPHGELISNIYCK